MTASSPTPQNFGGPTIKVRTATVSRIKKPYRVNKRSYKPFLKEISVGVTVISSLCEVLPRPLPSFLLDFSKNGLSGVT